MGARILLAIFAGGVAGGVARAALEQAWPASGHGWPWVTFAVNIAGTALLAYVITSLDARIAPSIYARSLLGIGLCGALTTFSTLQLELLRMLDRSQVGLALGYAAASIVAGFLAIAAATNLVRRGRLSG